MNFGCGILAMAGDGAAKTGEDGVARMRFTIFITVRAEVLCMLGPHECGCGEWGYAEHELC